MLYEHILSLAAERDATLFTYRLTTSLYQWNNSVANLIKENCTASAVIEFSSIQPHEQNKSFQLLCTMIFLE